MIHYDSNGWACVGKYVGIVIDESSYDGINGYCYFTTSEVLRSQRNRVYQDELNYFNSKT